MSYTVHGIVKSWIRLSDLHFTEKKKPKTLKSLSENVKGLGCGEVLPEDVLVAINTKVKGKVQVTQSCGTLVDPMDYTVCGILQARILEWVVFPFSRGSSQPRDRTQVSRIVGGFFPS